jgi:hypothetical protein
VTHFRSQYLELPGLSLSFRVLLVGLIESEESANQPFRKVCLFDFSTQRLVCHELHSSCVLGKVILIDARENGSRIIFHLLPAPHFVIDTQNFSRNHFRDFYFPLRHDDAMQLLSASLTTHNCLDGKTSMKLRNETEIKFHTQSHNVSNRTACEEGERRARAERLDFVFSTRQNRPATPSITPLIPR